MLEAKLFEGEVPLTTFGKDWMLYVTQFIEIFPVFLILGRKPVKYLLRAWDELLSCSMRYLVGSHH